MEYQIGEKTGRILDIIHPQVTTLNEGLDSINDGVLFRRNKTLSGAINDEAYFITQGLVGRVSGIGEMDFPVGVGQYFFNFHKNEFTENTTVFRGDDKFITLINKMDNVVHQSGEVMLLPVSNIENHLHRLFPDVSKMKHSRSILKTESEQFMEGELFLVYEGDGVFRNAIDKDIIFRPTEESPVKDAEVGKMYIAETYDDPGSVQMDEITGLVTVWVKLKRETYKGASIGVHYLASGVYFPRSEAEYVDFSLLDARAVMKFPYGNEIPEPYGGYKFDPIHIHTVYLHAACQILTSFGYNTCKLVIKDRVSMLALIAEKPGLPKVELALGPLRPEIRGYYA